MLFSPYSSRRDQRNYSTSSTRSKKKNTPLKFWTVNFICLANSFASKVPSSYEKQQLLKAGLGPRKIKLNLDFSENEVIETLQSDVLTDINNPASFEGFPQLKNCGGFEILQCLPNSKDLTVINCSLATRLLKQKIGTSQTKVYIRPIQKSLSLKSIIKEEASLRKESCFICKEKYPVKDLRKHLWSHQSFINDGSSSDLDDWEPAEAFPQNNDTAAIGNDSADTIQPDAEDLLNDVIEVEADVENDKEESDINTIVDSVLSICCEKQLESNPVEILRCLQEKIVCGRPLDVEDDSICPEGQTTFIIVDRHNIVRTAFDEIRSVANIFQTLAVQFYDETAQDLGGPRKEFFRLCLRSIKDQYFDNGLNDNLLDDYETIGVIFSLSMLQNGPLIQFLSEEHIREVFNITEPSHPALASLRKGLSQLGVYQVSTALPLFQHLFRPSNVKLTLKKITSLLKPSFSESGTTARQYENDVYKEYLKYLREAASGRRGTVSLNHILRFATCTDEEPVLGFSIEPSLKFIETQESFLPSARTCTNTLTLARPTHEKKLPTTDSLFNLYDFAFNNSYFGNL